MPLPEEFFPHVQNVATLAAIVLIYSVVAGRVARSWLSGPMLFTGAGIILGPLGFDVLRLDMTATDLRAVAEAALAMVLFTDAARADLRVNRRNLGLPERLLLIGLPLTIILGFLAAMALFPALDLLIAALLATLLAPTDAALGAPVVTNEAVHAETREALNLESGLNDGICVPVVIILLELVIGTEIESSTIGHVVEVIVDEIGIGLLTGVMWRLPQCQSFGLPRASTGRVHTGSIFPLSPWQVFVSRRPRRSAAAASSRASSGGCCSATCMIAPKSS